MKAQVGDYIRYIDDNENIRISKVVDLDRRESVDFWHQMANGHIILDADISYDDVLLESEVEVG